MVVKMVYTMVGEDDLYTFTPSLDGKEVEVRYIDPLNQSFYSIMSRGTAAVIWSSLKGYKRK